MTKEIKLNNGMVSIVDDCDYDALSKYNWSIRRGITGILYANRHEITMHRQIMEFSSGEAFGTMQDALEPLPFTR